MSLASSRKPQPDSELNSELHTELRELREQVRELEHAEDVMRSIAERTFVNEGENFFRTLVRQMAEAFDVRYAVVGELICPDPQRIRTLAVWAGEDFLGNFEYDLAVTPCAHVVGRQLCCFPNQLQHHFPEHQMLADLDIQSYLGVPLFGRAREPIGVLVVMDDKPMPPKSTLQSMITVFAARAASEVERKRTDEALLDSENRFRKLFEDSPGALLEEDMSPVRERLDALEAEGIEDSKAYLMANKDIAWDLLRNVRIREVNKATVELYKAGSKDEVRHGLLNRGLLPETLPAMLESIEYLRAGHTSFALEAPQRDFTGQMIHTMVKVLVISGYEETWKRVLIGITDITLQKQDEEAQRLERRELERRVDQRTAELSRAHEELKSLLHIISHDLRAPLVNMRGFAGELRANVEDVRRLVEPVLDPLGEESSAHLMHLLDEEIPEALGFIDTSVNRIDGFMNMLLRLSQEGRRELSFQSLDVNDMVREILEILAFQLEQRQTEMRVAQLPRIQADSMSIEQILTNLLSNAVLYLDPERPGRIEVVAESTEEEHTFRIRDNGRGVPPADLDKIFLPFRRGKHLDVQGEGMGLAYVKTLVHRHGGRIWCESKLGEGSTFSFTLSRRFEHAGAEQRG